MTLLICPVRPGDSNEELRYAMRSWETNLAGEHRLLVVGYRPSWMVADYFIEGNLHASALLSIWRNVLDGARVASDMCSLSAEEAVFMNDDFFCVQPVESIEPVRRDITLAQHIAMFPAGASGWWPTSLRLTASFLASEGYPSPDSYEVHRPLVCAPAAMLSALSRWQGGTSEGVPQWRTVYGVLNEIEAEPVRDSKLGLPWTNRQSPWVSTSDQSWRQYAPTMKRRFQKPSRWEKN